MDSLNQTPWALVLCHLKFLFEFGPSTWKSSGVPITGGQFGQSTLHEVVPLSTCVLKLSELKFSNHIFCEKQME